MNRRRWPALLLLAGLLCAPSLGDDTTAAIGVGGLVFTHSTDIRMAREDLYISPQQVRIHFEFYNDSPKDITAIVAFPRPDLDTAMIANAGVGFPTHDPLNFVAFQTKVNGQPVATRAEQHALVGKRDITSDLKKIAVPISGDALYAQSRRWTHAQIAALTHLGAAAPPGPDGDTFPTWSVQTRFWWRQTFPAHQITVIDHSYRPISGGAQIYQFAPADTLHDVLADPESKARCLGTGLSTAIQHLIAAKQKALSQLPPAKRANPGVPVVLTSDVDYILTTGGNWKGPIGIFHLTLDK
ncbi:MAG TPA: DUF4424 family protein, partial [Terriglobales bacterium]|nr:DUF4424 family protein [Terriglobales bacterium]